jgi:hypothetical protein
MAWGQITGVRALQWLKETLGLAKSERVKMFTAEQMPDMDGKSFGRTVSELERIAAKEQDARWRSEHTDAFCFLRDYRYGRRSRRWLMAKAFDTRLENNSELWAHFCRVNHATDPTIDRLYRQNVNQLVRTPFSKLLKT